MNKYLSNCIVTKQFPVGHKSSSPCVKKIKILLWHLSVLLLTDQDVNIFCHQGVYENEVKLFIKLQNNLFFRKKLNFSHLFDHQPTNQMQTGNQGFLKGEKFCFRNLDFYFDMERVLLQQANSLLQTAKKVRI